MLAMKLFDKRAYKLAPIIVALTFVLSFLLTAYSLFFLKNLWPLFIFIPVLVLFAAISIHLTRYLAKASGAYKQAINFQEKLFQGLPNPAFIVDAQGNIVQQNIQAMTLTGFDKEELMGMPFINLIPIDQHQTYADSLKALSQEKISDHSSRISEYLLVTKDCQEIPIEIATTIVEQDGEKLTILNIWDISKSKKILNEIKERESMLKLAGKVFDYSAEAIIVTDAERKILKVNPAFEKITHFTQSEVMGRRPEEFLKSHRHEKAFYQSLWKQLSATGMWRGEIWDKRKSGEVFPTMQTMSVVTNEKGEITQYIDLLSDITDKKEQEEYIQNLAHYDQLTGLPNRALFLDRLNQAINRSKRSKKPMALLFIDLDRFKYVNDTLGHDAGDKLLEQIAKRLKKTIREQDTVSRLGGDEFTMILEEMSQVDDHCVVTSKIIAELGKPMNIAGHDVVIGASIGVSLCPMHGDQSETLIKSADTAMYHAKERGRNQAMVYEEAMSQVASDKFHLENMLRKALEKQELTLHYQPQIDINHPVVRGCEALVRWEHPEKGLVSPIEFISLAEETGLIIPMGEWVLRTAIKTAKRWADEGLSQLSVAVNVSGKQITNGNFCHLVEAILRENDFSPAHLELEITESAIIENPALAIRELNQLRELGINISLDDFGTGYSSLSYLKKLPVTKVKIDRSFVRDVNFDKDDEEIVNAIIAMTRTLGLKVIAEGVETEDQIAFIQRSKCDDVQGYFYSRPLPEDEFVAFVRKFNGL